MISFIVPGGLLLTNEPVEFEKSPVEAQNSRKISDRFRGICRMYLKLLKKSRKITTCNPLDLETQGFCSIMPKKLPGSTLMISYPCHHRRNMPQSTPAEAICAPSDPSATPVWYSPLSRPSCGRRFPASNGPP